MLCTSEFNPLIDYYSSSLGRGSARVGVTPYNYIYRGHVYICVIIFNIWVYYYKYVHFISILHRNSLGYMFVLCVLAGHGDMAPLLCNKDPFALRSMSHIKKMFPNSKFIMMIRDARSVSHSIISRHITIKGFDMKSYAGSIKDWNRAIGTMWEACKGNGKTLIL